MKAQRCYPKQGAGGPDVVLCRLGSVGGGKGAGRRGGRGEFYPRFHLPVNWVGLNVVLTSVKSKYTTAENNTCNIITVVI